MNEIFGTDIAQIINSAFAGNLLPLTLHKKTLSDPDDYGSQGWSVTDYAGEGVRTSWNSALVLNRGYPKDVVKIIVLQNGIATPTTVDSITIMSETWNIIDIERDPVDATWSLAAVRA